VLQGLVVEVEAHTTAARLELAVLVAAAMQT
jgi:hypothetical protein